MSLPTVLLYNLETEKGDKIRLLCSALKIKSRNVTHDEYGEKIAALSGLIKERKEPFEDEADFTDEMMIMANFSSSLLDVFLKSFKKYKIPGIGLKAVMTLKSSEWNSIKLHEELKAEHIAIKNSQPVVHHSGKKKKKK